MDTKVIEDVINSLSKEEEEEKENSEDVIREILKSDKTTKENTEKAVKALRRSFSEYSHLLQSLEEEKAALRRVREELQLMVYAMYLTAIPDSKFHNA